MGVWAVVFGLTGAVTPSGDENVRPVRGSSGRTSPDPGVTRARAEKPVTVGEMGCVGPGRERLQREQHFGVKAAARLVISCPAVVTQVGGAVPQHDHTRI